MSKRTLLCCTAVSVSAFSGALAIAILVSPEDRITQAMAGQIKKGMTMEQVTAILGKDPGVGTAGIRALDVPWKGANGTIFVEFSVGDGKVLAAWFNSGLRDSRSPLDRVTGWVRCWLIDLMYPD